MRLVCISDTHGMHEGLHLPSGDVLVHAGDLCSRGTLKEAQRFMTWFSTVGNYSHRVFCAGNHDRIFEDAPDVMRELVPDNVHYLNDSGVTIGGLHFWGSPVTPYFFNWAFNRFPHEIEEHWNLIPDQVDVLVTHGPPKGILDRILDGEEVGCPRLLSTVERIAPRLHLCGHIHEAYGTETHGATQFVNASICTADYQLANAPITVDLAR